MQTILIGALVVVLLSGGWLVDHLASSNRVAVDRVAELESAAADDAALIDAQRLALVEVGALQVRLDQIATNTRALQAVLVDQDARRRREFLELVKNDQATRDWLAIAVPAAVGLRYARPESTDPATWRTPAALSPGPVPVARPVATTD